MRDLNQSGHFPSGNPRYYYRPKGEKGIPMPDAAPDSPEFRKAYTEAEEYRPTRAAPGTLNAAIEQFSISDEFAERAIGTRVQWARTFDDLRNLYGRLRYAGIHTKHIKSDLSKFTPHPANNRLKVWKALFRWLEEKGKLEIDPASKIKKRKTPKTRGHIPWTRVDFENFRSHWSRDTRQRMAFEIYYRSCAATIDAVSLGPGRVSNEWLTYSRSKTGGVAAVPWSAEAAPDWFEWNDEVELCPPCRHMTFIVTAHGRPRSIKSTSQWFSDACTLAGLPNLSAHGIRKGRAAIFKENGATQEQRMAVLGHETEQEATEYSRSADLRKVISGTKVPTLNPKLFQLGGKNE